MHLEENQLPHARKKKHCFRRWQHTLQLSPPSAICVRTTVPVRRCSRHQVAQNFDACRSESATRLTIQRVLDRTMTLCSLRFARACRHPRLRRTLVVSISMRASHTDVYPELLQDSMKPGDDIQHGAAHCRGWIYLRCGPVVELRDRTFLVRRALCLLSEPMQQDRFLLSGSRSPILAPKQVGGMGLAVIRSRRSHHRCLCAMHT